VKVIKGVGGGAHLLRYFLHTSKRSHRILSTPPIYCEQSSQISVPTLNSHMSANTPGWRGGGEQGEKRGEEEREKSGEERKVGIVRKGDEGKRGGNVSFAAVQ
jgi:hypothetical protein